MTWLVVPGVEIRRRAVVAGRVVGAAGPLGSGDRALSLVAGAPGRRYACQFRGGDAFFFLDVPPGRYTLEAASGVELKPRRVVVPDYADDARMPVVRLDVEIVPPVAPPAAHPN